MEKILLIVFDNESQACQGEQALQELDADGSIAVFASALIAKDDDGEVTVRKTSDRSTSPLAASAVVGALAGLAVGPVGAAVGAAGGAMLGAMYDLVKSGGRQELLAETARQLQPGKTAVMAEVEEQRVLPVETRMSALGGVVYRLPRTDVEDVLIERELEKSRAEIAMLREKCSEVEGEERARIESRLAEAEKKLKHRILDARAAMEAAGRVAEARARTLERRGADADGDRREMLESGAADIRADYERRRARLTAALGEAQSIG